MGEAVDRPVIWGQNHRYQLGPAVGDRSFWASDEVGHRWVTEIGRTEVLEKRVEVGAKLPTGTLPAVREIGQMPGGRLSYLVQEWRSGFPLSTFLKEGRCLSPAELRKMGLDIGKAVASFLRIGVEVEEVIASDILYDTETRAWRLLAVRRVGEYASGPALLKRLAEFMLQAGGGMEADWMAKDKALASLLLDTKRDWRVPLNKWMREMRRKGAA